MLATRTTRLLRPGSCGSQRGAIRLACVLVGALALTGLLSGCGESEPNFEMPPPPPIGPDGRPILSAEDLGGDSAKAEEPDFDWSQPIVFNPPHPHRRDPFAANGAAAPDPSKVVRQTNSGGDGAIRVKGFVNVNGLRVVMRVGGEVRSLREGESLQGLKIVRIAPPHVTFVHRGAEVTRSVLREKTDTRRTSASRGGQESAAESDGRPGLPPSTAPGAAAPPIPGGSASANAPPADPSPAG